jgi:hypothetical protein
MISAFQLGIFVLAAGFLAALVVLTFTLRRPRDPDDTDATHAEFVKLRREVAGVRAEWTDAREQLNRLLGRLTRQKGWDQLTLPSAAPESTSKPVTDAGNIAGAAEERNEELPLGGSRKELWKTLTRRTN